ncbi:MAG: protein translocase subunit SecF [Pseudomonadales bacterium]|nr:protein translocase subunit SecF [Candidatus Woesebacteria bacterium]MCB9802231.1 protein translocase subunit SecF [Pseudomonadales bacterium]
MKHYRWYFVISLLVIVPGLISLGFNGVPLGVDFTGGSLLDVSFSSNQVVTTQEVEAALLPYESFRFESVRSLGNNQFSLRFDQMELSQKDAALATLSNIAPASEQQFATVGPTFSSELLTKTLTAVLIAAICIVLYVWRQFSDLQFGVSALLAMLHDTVVLVGSYSMLSLVLPLQVDTLFVTAVLTTLSFSVHDTIVVFDRIRELQRSHTRAPMHELVGVAVLETLGRSLNNSLTIIIMLLSLVLLGGESIFGFALALLIGAITGTYSSTFTAAPLLIEWERWKKRPTAAGRGRSMVDKTR